MTAGSEARPLWARDRRSTQRTTGHLIWNENAEREAT